MASFTPQQIEQFLQEFFDVVGSRQYIGARYVPVFGHGGDSPIEWDGGLEAYEPLSIVYHVGETYTSRKYVPASVDIRNTDYWVVTANYNAQMEQYRQEVLSFNQRINDNAQAVLDEASARDDADTQIREDVANDYIPFPDGVTWPKFGTLGQVLTTLADGDTKWQDPVVPSDAQAEAIITQWLTDHPEATTTVQDNSLTTAKYQNGSVTDAKLASDGLLKRALQFIESTSFASYVTTYTDFDGAPDNSVFRFQARGGVQQITDAPTDVLGTLFTIGYKSATTLRVQYYVENENTGNIWVRYEHYTDSINWHEWVNILDSLHIADNSITDAKLVSTGIKRNAIKFMGNISFNDYVSSYTDADSAPGNSVFRFINRAGTQQIPNIPTDELGTLITVGYDNTTNLFGQYYIESNSNGKIWMRYQSWQDGIYWDNWFNILENLPQYYTINKSGSNTKYSSNSLLEGLLYCYDNNIKEIRVKPGTYDMVLEYTAKYGANWDTEVGQYLGIPLGRGMRVIFDDGAKVSFNYTGSVSDVNTYMSLFNTKDSDCYVDGLDFECSNIRYGIHDDCSGSANPYIHTFKNCKIKKVDNNLNWTSSYAIAGGTGKYGRVEIDGGIFMCQNIAVAAQNQVDTIYYHNNSAQTGSTADIYIHGIYCYGPSGTVHSGSQVQQDSSVVNMYVYGCRFNTAPTEGDPLAMKLYAWGNTIESD